MNMQVHYQDKFRGENTMSKGKYICILTNISKCPPWVLGDLVLIAAMLCEYLFPHNLINRLSSPAYVFLQLDG